jgi:hypothetical protein
MAEPLIVLFFDWNFLSCHHAACTVMGYLFDLSSNLYY